MQSKKFKNKLLNFIHAEISERPFFVSEYSEL